VRQQGRLWAVTFDWTLKTIKSSNAASLTDTIKDAPQLRQPQRIFQNKIRLWDQVHASAN
jgi:hypothetical protein